MPPEESPVKIVGVFVCLAVATVSASASGDVTSDLLIGSWACESGACPDEEIAFAVEDGARTYNSWLHARPSASDGRWSLTGDRLVIECCEGPSYDYVLVRVTDRELVLRDVSTEEEAVLTRIGDAPAGQ
jgi:hypothetical protein